MSSRDLNVLHKNIMVVSNNLFNPVNSLAFMTTLTSLVAMNIGCGVVAMLGGKEWVAAVVILCLSLRLCFKQLYRCKYACKQKSRLRKRQSRLSQRGMMRQLRVMLLFCMLTSLWTMDVNVVAQMADQPA